MEQLKKLLQEVNVILQKEKVRKEESRKRGERFNVFEMLGVAHYELTHSKIIAGFLNPQGSHGQGDLFLRLFLQTIENKDEINIDTSKAKVYTEYGIGVKGRLDIFIDNGSYGFIIENKVYAGDGEEQLKRYNDFAKEKYGEGNYIIYYLTLDGHEASEDSVKNKETGECVNYKRISYSKDIIDWLQRCIHECATMPLVRETLVQYLNHIKQLTNQDMGNLNEEELIKLLAENTNFETAVEVGAFIANADNVKKIFSLKLQDSINSIKKDYENNSAVRFPVPKEYDDRAIFVVEIGGIHVYIGWSSDKFPQAQLYCQAEYDSYFRVEKERPELNESFNKLGIHDLLSDNDKWCLWKYFAYNWVEAFKCLKNVVEIIIQNLLFNVITMFTSLRIKINKIIFVF